MLSGTGAQDTAIVALEVLVLQNQRRGGDLNPRTPVGGQLISSESDSAALAPLLALLTCSPTPGPLDPRRRRPPGRVRVGSTREERSRGGRPAAVRRGTGRRPSRS